jgi:predicted ATPase
MIVQTKGGFKEDILMFVSHIRLTNWRNFKSVDVPLGKRVFLVGPNASGKSNFLDVFRFLRDITMPGGGLQKAITDRGGLSKIRCLSARTNPMVEIEIHLSEVSSHDVSWRYAIGIKQESHGRHDTKLAYEKVWHKNKLILERPDKGDLDDNPRLSQTFLEQINMNAPFREINDFLESIVYLHLIPQLLRYPDAFAGPMIQTDPFGRSFLERIAKTPKKTMESRLKKIENALRIAVPHFKELSLIRDENGVPHLQAIYEHWRDKGAKQMENQFSDGTLRLIGLLWSLLEGDSTLLMEEPELSLNAAIVTRIPSIINRLQKNRNRQVILSTHSADLLSDLSIGGQEIIMLTPEEEGTKVQIASSIPLVCKLLEGGMSPGEAILPQVQPKNIEQLGLFQ